MDEWCVYMKWFEGDTWRVIPSGRPVEHRQRQPYTGTRDDSHSVDSRRSSDHTQEREENERIPTRRCVRGSDQNTKLSTGYVDGRRFRGWKSWFVSVSPCLLTPKFFSHFFGPGSVEGGFLAGSSGCFFWLAMMFRRVRDST